MKQQQRKTWESSACRRFPALIGAEGVALQDLLAAIERIKKARAEVETQRKHKYEPQSEPLSQQEKQTLAAQARVALAEGSAQPAEDNHN